VPKADTIADIGADHGKVSAYIYRNSFAKNLIVNDISADSLQKAKKLFDTLKPNGTAAQFILSDGADLKSLISIPIDCIIIAGLGGREITKIITALMPPIAILDPRKNIPELRQSLLELDYQFIADTHIQDKGRFYDIMCVERRICSLTKKTIIQH